VTFVISGVTDLMQIGENLLICDCGGECST
jgi:hypothetical protein